MRDGIPIFFSSCGKENGHSWSKEKTLRDELTGKAVNSPKAGAGRHALPTKSGSWLPAGNFRILPAGNCRQNPEVACRLRYTRISNRHIPAFESAEHNGAENRIGVFLLPCVPLRYALPGPFPVLSSSLALRPLGGWFFLPRPSSPGGGSKGESTKAPPGADKAARFRGNGTIGGPSGLGIVLP